MHQVVKLWTVKVKSPGFCGFSCKSQFMHFNVESIFFSKNPDYFTVNVKFLLSQS